MAVIQLTDEYNSLGGVGGTCALCNASKRKTDRPERIITTDLVTDMQDAPPGVWPEKWMEFCETCVTEMAHLIGMVTEREYQTLMQELEQAEMTIAGQAEELSMYKKEVSLIAELKQYLEPQVEKVAASTPARRR